MAEAQAYDQELADLPPPGQRWGAGAQSVLPYLTKSLQAKPAAHGPDNPRESRAPSTAPALHRPAS